MTSDPRVDRLEGIMERIAREHPEIRQDMRDLRNALLTVNLVMWVTTIGTILVYSSRISPLQSN